MDFEDIPALDHLSGKAFKPFACPDCDKHFTRLTYVQRHQRLAHLGKRDHICPKCGAGFARTDVLNRHMQNCGNGKTRKRKAQQSPEATSPMDPDPFGLNFNVNAFTVPSMGTGGLPLNLSLSSGSSTENSPLFERASGSGSGSTPGSDLAASPEQLPLFSDMPPMPTFTVPTTTMTTTTTTAQQASLIPVTNSMGELTYVPYADAPEGFDPFAPLRFSGSGFSFAGFPSPDPGTPNFFDLMAAASVHEPSPLTFRNPDATIDLNALVKPFTQFDEKDARFQLGSERIAMITAIGLQKKFKFPTAQGFEKLAALAGSYMATFNPVIHMATFNLNTDDLSIGVALATAGASKGNPLNIEGAKEMSEHILKEKRDYYIQDFSKRTVEIDSASGGFVGCGETWTGVIRSFLIYQTIGFSHASKAERRLSATYHGALINMCRLVNFVGKASDTMSYIESTVAGGRPLDTLGPQQLDQHWRKVAQAEQFIRTAWMIWLIDLALAGCHQTPASLTFSEYGTLRLPCNEAAWTASTASEWALMDAVYPGPQPTLLQALRSAFECPDTPDLGSGFGAFAGSILRRTLLYLQQRLQRAPPAPPGFTFDPAVNILWAEVGLLDPPSDRQGALARIEMAGQVVCRACPMPDMAGQDPGGCTLSALDEGLN